MKENSDCNKSPRSSDSEMAVSLLSTGGTGLKRPMEDMLDSVPQVRIDGTMADSEEPLSLLNAFNGKNKKFKKDELDAALYFNNNSSIDSDGGSVKPSDQEESEPEHDDATDLYSNSRHSQIPYNRYNEERNDQNDVYDSHKEGSTNVEKEKSEHKMPTSHTFPCVWLDGNNSPLRDGDRREHSPPPPPALLPISSEERATSQRTPQPFSQASSSLASEPDNTPAPLRLMSTPNGLNPLVAADINVRSPSEALTSDGELSLGGNSPMRCSGSPLPPGASPLPANTTIIDQDGQSVEVCPQCHKVFKRKVYLQRHMEREHWSTAKVFKCQDCNYETKHQSNLSVHRRTHTGERPYHCGMCGQRYTQGHLLKSHIRSRHGGNMEFYNLEKKSDSTRGRKSLDIKHELLPPLPPHPHKQDNKISSLLQAAAAVGSSPSSVQTPPKSPFGSMVPNFMSSMPYLRPGMSPSMMSASMGLLNNSRFFPGMPGMSPNGLPGNLPMLPGMPPLLPLSSSSNFLPTSSSESIFSGSPLKLPVKMPEENVSPNKFSPNYPPLVIKPDAPNESRVNETLSNDAPQDLSVPQDLSLKKEDAVSPAKSATPVSEALQLTPPTAVIANGFQNNSTDGPHDLSNARRPSLSEFPTPPSDHPHHSPHHQEPEHDQNHTPHNPLLLSPNHPALGPLEPPTRISGKVTCIASKNCSHEEQLLKLRKNVMRMLSVLTPDIGIENDIDFSTDQVDQLLYEVIYSNMD